MATALGLSDHMNSYSTTLTIDALSLCVMILSVDTLTEHHARAITTIMNSIQQLKIL